MIVQSTIHNTESKLYHQVRNYYVDSSIKYIVKERFNVGNKPKLKDIKKLNILQRAVCLEGCVYDNTDKSFFKEKLNTFLIKNLPEI